jgi:hypothetical protein
MKFTDWVWTFVVAIALALPGPVKDKRVSGKRTVSKTIVGKTAAVPEKHRPSTDCCSSNVRVPSPVAYSTIANKHMQEGILSYQF